MRVSISTSCTSALLVFGMITGAIANTQNTESTVVTASTLESDASVFDADEITRILALSDDVAYGEYLAGECASCHSRNVVQGSNVPVIHGAPASHVVRALLEYRSGYRTNTTMGNVASSLGDEEVAVLAHYLASLEQ